MKSDPMIVAAGPKPPRPTISVPAISGPMQAMRRGALNIKAMAVPRILVGNNSGSQTGAHAQMPRVKKIQMASYQRSLITARRSSIHQ